MSMYLRASKIEAQAAGEDIDGMANSVSELRDKILALTNGDVDIQIDEDTFKSTYQIMKELSNVYKNLRGVDQAALLELIGGKRNANVVASILENFQIAEDALKSSQESAGSAMRENEKYVQSIAGRIEQFKESFQSLSSTIISSDLVKTVVSVGTEIISIIDKIIGSAGPLIAIVSTMYGLKKTGINDLFSESSISRFTESFTKAKTVIADLVVKVKNAGGAMAAMRQIGATAGAALNSAFGPISLTIGAITLAVTLLTGAYNYLSNASDRAADKHEELSQKYKETADNVKTLEKSIKSTSDRIAELEGIKARSDAEDSELGKLREEIQLLEFKLQLEREQLEIDREKRVNAARDTLTSKDLVGEHKKYSFGTQTQYVHEFSMKSPVERGSEIVSEINEINKAMLESAKIANDPNVSKNEQERHKHVVKDLEDRRKRLSSELLDIKEKILPAYEDLKNAGSLTEGDVALLEKVENILKVSTAGIGAGAASADKNGNVLGLTKEDLSLLNGEIDTVQSKISSLSSALAGVRDGSLGIEDVINLMQEFPELAPHVDLTAKGFGNLSEALEDMIKKSPKSLIAKLRELKDTSKYTDEQKIAIDRMCDALESLPTDAIKQTKGEFGVLADAINDATAAKIKLDKALQEDDYDSGYDRRVEAFKEFKKIIQSGEIGSKAYAAYVDYFKLGGKSNEYITTWLKDNNKYFTETSVGLNQFLSMVDKMDDVGGKLYGIASYDNAKKEFLFDPAQIDEFARRLGWSPEMLQDVIGKYRMFSGDFFVNSTESIVSNIAQDSGIQKLGDAYITTFENISAAAKASGDSVEGFVEKLPHAMSDNIVAAIDPDIYKELVELGNGGNVDLTFRPKVDASMILDKGWTDGVAIKAGDVATVFTETFSNLAGDVAVNFTPIQVDENGNFVGVLNQDEFTKYCEDVIEGVREDDLNLQIGAKFTGADAIKEASAAADRIHELHQQLLSVGEVKILGQDQIVITQSIIDGMHNVLGSVEEVEATIKDFSGYDGVQFEAGITFNGKTVDEIIGSAAEDAGDVPIKLNLSVNDDEVIAEVTAVKGKIDEILGDGCEAVIKCNTSDAVKKAGVLNLLLNAIGNKKIVATVNGNTTMAQEALSTVLGYLRDIARNKSQIIDITYRYNTVGTPPAQHAKGTKHAKKGYALLGDEYSPTGDPKPELVLTGDSAYVAGLKGPEFGFLNEGDVVFNARDTRKILGRTAATTGTFPRFASGKGLIGSLVSSVKNVFNNIVNKFKKPKPSQTKQPSSTPAKKQTSGNMFGSLNTNTSVYSPKPPAYSSPQALKDTIDRVSAKPSDIMKSSNSGWIGGTHGSLNGNRPSGGGGGVSSGSSGSESSGSGSEKKESEFERQYKEHQHLLKMEKEKYADYIKWLEKAYQEAYAKGEIELDDYRKYAEEVFEGQKELFQDQLNDIEHQISALEREKGNDNKIINMYLGMIESIKKEIQAAKDRGLNENDDWIQELQGQLNDYEDAIKDIQDEIKENAEDSVKDLIDYRIDMIKKELEEERDALKDKLGDLKDFYNKQKEMLQDAYDEEKKLEQRNEKQKKKSDLEAELAQLEFDDSAWAEKRRLELKEQLAAANKDLEDFEKDNALEDAKDLLDKMYDKQEEQINKQIEAIEEKLNDPKMLYNQALKDIQNNTKDLFLEMVKYNDKYGSGNSEDITNMWNESKESLDRFLEVFGKAYKDIIMVSPPTGGYASGTRSATKGVHRVDERGPEWLFTSSDGSKYRIFSGGEKVLDAAGTNFLYNFANSGGRSMISAMSGFGDSIKRPRVNKSQNPINLSTGDVIINGNADSRTVSEIRRAQREGIDYILKEFTHLSK